MLKKISKKLIIFSSLFLTFFCFQNVFAETGDKGIIIERFEYDENDELILSWSVDYGYSDWKVQKSFDLYGSYATPINKIYIDQLDCCPTLNTLMIYNENWGNIIFSYDLIDCYEIMEGGLKQQQIFASDFGNKTCSIKFTSFGSQINNLFLPENSTYVKKSDIDYRFYTTDFLESINLDFYNTFNRYTWFYEDINNGGGEYRNFNPYDDLTPFTASSTFPIVGGGSASEPTNGSCGSDADMYSFYDNPPTNLCSTGTSDNFTFNGLAYRTGSTWSWDCLGENGGSDTSCVSYLDPNSKVDGVCGDYANQDFQTVEDFNGFSPYNTYHKCSQGLYNSTSFVASVNTVSWYCTGINYGVSAFCTAHLITPTTDAFDYSDFELPDFYEDLTNKGWFVEAMAWLFLPTPETLKDSYDIGHEFRLKAPHGYLAKFHDFFMSIVSESPEPIPFPELVITPFAGTEPVTFFNFVSFVEIVGADNFSRFYHFLELLIGAVVIGYLVKRGIRFIKELK